MTLSYLLRLVPLSVITYGTATKFISGCLGKTGGLKGRAVSDPLLLQFFNEMVEKLNLENPVLLMYSKEAKEMFSSYGHQKKRMRCIVVIHQAAFTLFTTDEIKFLMTRELVKITESDHASWKFLPEGAGAVGFLAGSFFGGPAWGAGASLSFKALAEHLGGGFREALIDAIAMRALPLRIAASGSTTLEKLIHQASKFQSFILRRRLFLVKALNHKLLAATEV